MKLQTYTGYTKYKIFCTFLNPLTIHHLKSIVRENIFVVQGKNACIPQAYHLFKISKMRSDNKYFGRMPKRIGDQVVSAGANQHMRP